MIFVWFSTKWKTQKLVVSGWHSSTAGFSWLTWLLLVFHDVWLISHLDLCLTFNKMKNLKVGSERVAFFHILALLTLFDVQSILILKTQRLVVSGWPSSRTGFSCLKWLLLLIFHCFHDFCLTFNKMKNSKVGSERVAFFHGRIRSSHWIWGSACNKRDLSCDYHHHHHRHHHRHCHRRHNILTS